MGQLCSPTEGRHGPPPGIIADLVGLTSDGVVLHSRGRVRYANPAFAAMLGYASASELTGAYLDSILAPEFRTIFRERMAALAEGQRIQNPFEEKLVHADGHGVLVEVASTLTTVDGEQYMLTIVRDITERRRREEAMRAELAQRERLFRSLFQHSMDGALLSEPGGPVLMANPAICRMLGYTEQEIVEQGRAVLIDPTDPAILAALAERDTTGRYRGELVLKDRNGERVPCEVSAVRFTAEDGHEYSSILIRDLRKQKAAALESRLANDRFRRFVENLSTVVWRVGSDGAIIESHGWAELTGQPAEQPNRWLEAIHPEDRKPLLDELARAREAKRAYRKRIRVRTKAGEYRWMEARGVPLFDDRENLVEWVGITEDVHEAQSAVEALEQRERMYRALFDTTAQGVIIQDADGAFIEVNAAAASILGLQQADLMGKTSHSSRWLTLRADGSEMPIEERPSVRALRVGERVDGQLMGIWRESDQRMRWLLIHARPLFRRNETKPYQVFVGFSDITEVREATAAAALAAERTNRIIETVNDAITIVSAEGEITYANAAAERVFGLETSQIRSRRYDDVRWRITDPDGSPFPPQDLPFAVVKRTGAPVNDIKHAIEYEDGRRVILSINAAPLRDPDGGFAGIVAAIRDVTELHREHVTRSRLAAIVESSADAIIGKTADGIITSWNSAATRIFGYEPAEIMGQHINVLLPDAEDDTCDALLAEMRAGRRVERFECVLKTKSGTHVAVALSMSPVTDASGAVVGVATIVRDVSLQKAAQEQLRFQAGLLDHVQEAVGAVDGEGRLLYVNPKAAQLFGWPRDRVLGRNIFEITSNRAPASATDIIRSALGGRSWLGELKLVNQRLEEFPALVSAGPLYDAEDQVVGVVAVASDLTQVRSLEQQLSHAQKLEAVGRLAGGVAHDFNNVLTSIQGHAQLALDNQGIDEVLRDDLQEIVVSARRATSLTRQLLAFSRRQVLQPRVVELADIVRPMDKMLRRLIGEDVQLVSSCEEDLRARIDPGQIEQVILNLVVNARDAMPKGGRIAISVSAHDVDAPIPRDDHEAIPVGRYAVITVSDNGCGIPHEVRDRIFDPFFTTKPAGKGTGLGLSTVYGIVKQSGGYVTVYSEDGLGTTFRVYVPRVFEAAPAPARVDPPAANGDARGTVLLVEDEPAVRGLARRILAARGYTVLFAEDGTEAIEIANHTEAQIDLLITDTVMPKLGGVALALELRKTRPDLPVLLMSGYSEEIIAQQGQLPGWSSFLEKPFTAAALLESARSLLERRSR